LLTFEGAHKLILLIVDINHAKISIDILHPETLQQEYSISRAQEKYLKNEAKTAYYKGEHISIDYVPIGPQLNRKVIERLLSSDIGKYLSFDNLSCTNCI